MRAFNVGTLHAQPEQKFSDFKGKRCIPQSLMVIPRHDTSCDFALDGPGHGLAFLGLRSVGCAEQVCVSSISLSCDEVGAALMN